MLLKLIDFTFSRLYPVDRTRINEYGEAFDEPTKPKTE